MFWKMIKVVLMLTAFVAFVIGGLYFSVNALNYAFKSDSTPTKTTSTPQPQGDRLLNWPPIFPNLTEPSKKFDYPVILLEKRNTLILRNVVTAQNMSILTKQALQMSHALPKKEPIYLFIDSPGGDVDSGLAAIDAFQALPQEIKTITLFSASMAFHIVENLGERLILPSGTLMSHRVSISNLRGSVPGNAVTRLNNVLNTAIQMDTIVAKRIGMKLEDYQALIADEWWGRGEENIKYNMADRVVLVQCDTVLSNETYWQVLDTPFGTIKVQWSSCPLIIYPFAVELEGDNEQLQLFISTLLYNKKQFIEKYIKSGLF